MRYLRKKLLKGIFVHKNIYIYIYIFHVIKKMGYFLIQSNIFILYMKEIIPTWGALG